MNEGGEGADATGLRRVVVYEHASGVCLFSQTWGQWKGDQTRSKVCGLVQFFFQLAREIDSADPDVTRVAFSEPQRAERPRIGPFHSRFASAPPRSSSKKSTMGIPTSMGLNMSCAEEGGLVAAVFYEDELDVESMRSLAQDIVKTFLERYQEKINEMGNLFEEAMKTPDFIVDEDAVISPFQDFSVVVTEMRNAVTKIQRE